MKKSILLVLFFIFSIFCLGQGFYTAPAELYEESTEHYKFVFEKDLYDIYYGLKDYAEFLYSEYSKFYYSNPGKLTVFILDDVDYVNSYAAAGLRTIRLFINAPKITEGLGNSYSEWVKFVFSHELNHVFYGISLNPGLDWIPSNLFKGAIGNTMKPSYMHEGLSVYMESKNYSGRYRDNIFNMFLREEVLSKDYPRYHLGSGSSVNVWSPGGFDYMYGTLLTKEIYERYGEEKLKSITKELNYNWLNSISGAFESITGDNWDKFLSKIKMKYENEEKTLISKGYKKDYNKTDETYHNTTFLNSDGTNLYAYKQMPDRTTGLYKNDELILSGVYQFDVSSSGKIIYVRSSSNNGKEINTLFLKCECPLSDKIISDRVSEFGFVSEDLVAYSKLENGKVALYMCNLNTLKSEKIIDYNNVVYSAIKGNGKDKIYLSIGKDKKSDIFVYDLKTKELKQITNDIYNEMSFFIRNGELYYSADYEDSIYNIYRMNLETYKKEKITNQITGAFYPAIVNDKIYYLVYDYNGYHISYKDYEYTKETEPEAVQNTIVSSITNTVMPEKLKNYIDLPKHFIIYPYLNTGIMLGSELIYWLYGTGVYCLSESMNYEVDIKAYTHGFYDNYVESEFKFRYLFNNVLDYKINFTDNRINYQSIYYTIWDNYDILFLKNRYIITSILKAGFSETSLDKINGQAALEIQMNPYRVNNNSLYSLKNHFVIAADLKNFECYDIISTKFSLVDFIFTPYAQVYYENNIFIPTAGLNISKNLWYPYLSLQDGKWKADGINAYGNAHFNFRTGKWTFGVGIGIDLSILYNYKIPIPIGYTF